MARTTRSTAGRDEKADARVVSGPRTTARVVGHERAVEVLRRASASGRMPHAWLFAGPDGLGKASLAFAWVRTLLARQAHRSESGHAGGAEKEPEGPGLFGDEAGEAPVPPSSSASGEEGDDGGDLFALGPDHPVFRQVAAGSHPDLLVLDPEELAAGEGGNKTRASPQIRVEDVRRIHRFYAHTASGEGWRITIIDGAEAMNRNAANALLKVLEEPPERALLILISHRPGDLLATIRSRCRTLAFQPLSPSEMHEFLLAHAPGHDGSTREAVARLAEGAPGRALELLRHDGLALYRELLELLAQEDAAAGMPARARFIDGLAADPERYRLVLRLWRDLHARLVRFAVMRPDASGDAPAAGPLPEEAALLERWRARSSPERWIERWEETGRLIAQAERLYLDRRQVLWTLFAEHGLPD